jgi:hypothetical protein
MRNCWLLAIVLTTGCASEYTLRMRRGDEPQDTSHASSKLAAKKYTKFIVISPRDTTGGEFDRYLSALEGQFVKRGYTIISSAITGKVEGDAPKAYTETERAFRMAKGTGAEALLQVGVAQWEKTNSRFFILDKNDGEKSFKEVEAAAYEAWLGPKLQLSCPLLRFSGKLLDVENGEVMLAFNYVVSADLELEEYFAIYKISSHKPYRLRENYSLTPAVWTGAMNRVESRVMELLTQKVTGQN